MNKHPERETVLVVDFGAQYVQLIVRKVREQAVYAEIRPARTPLAELVAAGPKGIIFSGGPSSVYPEGVPASACCRANTIWGSVYRFRY